MVQPDIIIMCDEEKVTADGKYEGVPTLVVEVLSKSTTSKDMVKKLSLYMNSNVAEYWVVDTERTLIHLYRFEDRELLDTVIFMKGMVISSYVFEGLSIPMNEIFNW